MAAGDPEYYCCFFLLILMLLSPRAAAQPKTDPSEVAALNAIFGRWGLAESNNWNISGEPCSGWATDGTALFNNGDFNPGIKCLCSYNNRTTCHINQLKVHGLNVDGPIPEELQNLKYLTYLDLGRNHLTGPIPAFIGELRNLPALFLGTNALSGQIPKELGQLSQLIQLDIGDNSFTGSLPEEIGNLRYLEALVIESSGLSGEFPQTLSNLKNLIILRASDNDLTGQIPNYIGGWINLQYLWLQGNYFQGSIPSSFANLVNVYDLRIGDIVNGSSSLAFISNMTSLSVLVLRNCNISDTLPSNFEQFWRLKFLDLSFNNIKGQLSESLFNLSSLTYLFLGNNRLSGVLPSQRSSSLLSIDLSYNQLSGYFPSWVSNKTLELNLVKNNFILSGANESILPSGLKCLQNDIPCFRNAPRYSSFAVKCGGNKQIRSSDGTTYDIDNATLGAASYFVTDQTKWGVSNVGLFVVGYPYASNYTYITAVSSQINQYPDIPQIPQDVGLFQQARTSQSSLRYYGIGLENGNYTVTLQFAEITFNDTLTWDSLARRVFDIYIQGRLQVKDFDIREQAGGKSFQPTAPLRLIAPVTTNFLEIHFFWAGKGTCCIPELGNYGPSISAISVAPYDFTPTVPNSNSGSGKNSTTGLIVGKKNSTTGLIVGIVVGIAALGLFAAVIFFCAARRKHEREKELLLNIVGRPDFFSLTELRAATDNFSSNNILGKGGYGHVYKGILPDGRAIAVKQLSEASSHGRSQFVAEIATISAVQQRNLVRLYGCCIDGRKPLLVYEFLPKGSLDKALIGENKLQLDWQKRCEICIGVASGLAYLHEESNPPIIHRDIKSGNILLDAELNPKISDFGLARLYTEQHTLENITTAGTRGYMPPEYIFEGLLSEKVDVYAFGVVLLEIVSGRRPTGEIYLVDLAWKAYLDNNALEIMDPDLKDSADPEEVMRVIGIALLCTQGPRHERPTMRAVVSMLKGEMEVANVTAETSYHKFGGHYMGASTVAAEDYSSTEQLYTSAFSTGWSPAAGGALTSRLTW